MFHSKTGWILSNYKINYRIHRSLPLRAALIQSNPAHLTHNNKLNLLTLIQLLLIFPYEHFVLGSPSHSWWFLDIKPCSALQMLLYTTQCICVFCVILKKNQTLYSVRHLLIGLSSRCKFCFLWGSNLTFICRFFSILLSLKHTVCTWHHLLYGFCQIHSKIKVF